MRACLCLATTFLACVSHLAAQSAVRPLAREAIQFAIWHEGDSRSLEPIQGLMTAAQRACPGVQIILLRLPRADPYRQMQQWCEPSARGVPDVVVVRDLWLPEFAAHLQPLNSLLPASALRPFPDSVKQRLRYAGNLYGVPWTVDCRALYYRPDLLQAAGVLPPRTWDELLVAARRTHRPPDVYGFGLPGVRDDSAAELLLVMLWAYGADLPPVENPAELDSQALQAALRLYSQLHDAAVPEVLSWDQAALEEFFLQGRIAMLIADRGFWDYLSQEAPAFPVATTPLPSGTRGSGLLSADLACIFRSSQHIPAAARFVRALTTLQSCEALVKWGSVPYHAELLARYRLDPAHAAFVATMEQARGLPGRRWPSARAALSEGLFYLLTGRKTVPQAAELIGTRLAQGQPVTPAP